MSSDENTDVEEQNDAERTEIRSELSALSFEELQKLKERIGAKVYKEALFGKKQPKQKERPVFKRENKNRPREMSSKKTVPMLSAVPEAVKKNEKEVRDPRFDPLCGEFDKKQFTNDYSFLSDMRMNDIKMLRKELKQTTDSDRQLQIRRLLQRLNDQHKSARKIKKETERVQLEKEKAAEKFKYKKQPSHYKNKSEKRVEELVRQYEEMKKEGTSRIERHLMRRQQKVKKRSFKAPTGVS